MPLPSRIPLQAESPDDLSSILMKSILSGYDVRQRRRQGLKADLDVPSGYQVNVEETDDATNKGSRIKAA